MNQLHVAKAMGWLCALGVAGLVSVASAGPLEDGNEAYDEGDYANALVLWRSAADQGSGEGQRKLGFMYYEGKGIEKDIKEAVIWYRKAADQGNARAQGSLGVFYLHGIGVTRDFGKALALFRPLAEQGNPAGQMMLGTMYGRGTGVPQDLVLAYMWSSLSARQGNLNAVEVSALSANKMTPTQMAEAQSLSQKCLVQNYKNCGR